QGVGGMGMASDEFMKALAVECKKAGVKLILDEVQSGCGRTGRYFAFQHYDIMPDIISVAKGIGNGFPMAGILIAPDIEARHGMLGTTFGGNHLACAAGSAVIDVMMEEHLMENAARVGAYAAEKLSGLPHVVAVKGRGLMLGVEFDEPIAAIRRALVFDKHIFTGAASNPCMIRILPPLCISEKDIDTLYDALLDILK
ncbi:MAG: aminotransferase class III-fold pyridoxal phosphate-dependent enzyme, partial [Flavobacteriales bacterium]|nr:aminotransferase class III-fold pyridoxal phosphate-dependent enzyme [Flavobacteriales bacterium]